MIDSKRRASLYLPGRLCGETVGDVIRELSFGATKRRSRAGGVKLFPAPETRLEPGDQLLFQGRYEKLAALKEQAVVADPR
ncbi:unnamed protein product [marine sediment metagenome]|uniref:RCK C-terminal domain-containing protein n=1 Tax=marine sediment metagenome TaxID=412755 RepID=X0RHC2_9ZZZZ